MNFEDTKIMFGRQDNLSYVYVMIHITLKNWLIIYYFPNERKIISMMGVG